MEVVEDDSLAANNEHSFWEYRKKNLDRSSRYGPKAKKNARRILSRLSIGCRVLSNLFDELLAPNLTRFPPYNTSEMLAFERVKDVFSMAYKNINLISGPNWRIALRKNAFTSRGQTRNKRKRIFLIV